MWERIKDWLGELVYYRNKRSLVFCTVLSILATLAVCGVNARN